MNNNYATNFSRKILLVEDDNALAKALGMRLQSFGYKTVVADDVSSAMSAVMHRKPDVLLIDINLPDGTGFDVARQVAKHPQASELPVIFTSASKNADYIERIKLFTPIPLLEKPFTSEQMMRTIELSQYAANQPAF